jgi:plasmid segregation protein ParM
LNIENSKGNGDVGNSSTKIIYRDGIYKRARKQPSVISYLPAVPKFEDEDLDYLVTNLHKNIVVNISSPALIRSGLYAVGDVANIYGGIGFNVRQHRKSERDLSIVQPLAMIAVAAVQNHYKQNGELAPSMVVEMEYMTAIPVLDYSKAAAKALEDKLIDSHVILVYIGEGRQVSVTVKVVAAKVVQEGIPAFYALANAPAAMFEKYNQLYGVEFTGEHFTKRKLLFIDIGDGTIELIYIVNGRPIVTKSRGVRLGVGHASEKAMTSFKTHYNFRANLTRANFMDKILDINDKWHNEANHELISAVFEQESLIFDTIADMIENDLQNDLDDVVIFGGGTNVFKNLQQQLFDYTKMYKLRLLWIDGDEASLLNAIGLDELNENVFFKRGEINAKNDFIQN